MCPGGLAVPPSVPVYLLVLTVDIGFLTPTVDGWAERRLAEGLLVCAFWYEAWRVLPFPCDGQPSLPPLCIAQAPPRSSQLSALMQAVRAGQGP